MKKLTLLLCLSLFCFMTGFSQGHETFDNFDEPGTSYVNGTFEGQDGSTWEYTQSRGDYEITGSALMLGRNRTPDAELISGTLNGGIGTLEFSYMQAFSNNVEMEVYINEDLVYTATSDSELDVVKSSGEIDINVDGDFTLRFFNPNGAQVVIDDVIWTAYEDENGGEAPEYCIPEGVTETRFINNFSTTGAQENISNMGSGFSEGGYGVFTDMTVAQMKMADVNFSVDVEGGTMGFRIWVDWNHDGVFDTENEVAYMSSGYNTSHEGSFTVPVSAETGTTRMRIASHWLSTNGNVDPCETGFTYGEFEDYSFEVIAIEECTGTPIAGNVADTEILICSATSFSLSVSGTSDPAEGLEMMWQSAPAGSDDWTDIAGSEYVFTYMLTDGIEEDTDFRFRATCTVSGESAYSEVISATINTNYEECYCVPTTTGNSAYIETFTATGDGGQEINNENSGAGTNDSGYSNFTDQVVSVLASEEVTYSMTLQSSQTAGFKIWVDWNRDGFFDEEGSELLYQSSSYNSSYSGSFVVPETASGSYRMRIGASYTPSGGPTSSCGNNSQGEFEDYTIEVIGLEACTDAVAGTPVETEIMICPLAPFTVEVEGNSEPADGLVRMWQSSPAGQDDWSDTGEILPSYTVSAGIDEATDYRYAVTCADGDTDYSDVISVTLNENTSECYCIPQATNSARYIDNFSTTGATNNVTNNDSGFSDGGYGDYTDMTITQFASQEVNFTADLVGGTMGFRIWVDWNQDGVFDAETEVAYQSSGYSAAHSGSFTVPENALSGTTRMRIVSHWLSNSGDIDPCTTGFEYGEFEDYTLEVEALAACSGADAGTPDETELSFCAGADFTVSVSDASEPADGLVRIWQSSPAGQDDWTDIEGSSSPSMTVSGGVTEATDYRYTATCGDEFDASDVITISLNPAIECYCIPSIPTGCGSDELSNFSLTHDGGTLNYDDGCAVGGPYYDLTDTVLNMTPGESYSGSANSISSFGEHVSIWIDLNQDGLFSEDERLTTVEGINAGPVDFTLAIPEDALPGETRMRVGQSYSTPPSNPCAWSYGMAIDYTISIGGDVVSCAAPENLAVDNITGNSADITWEAGEDCEGGHFEVVYGASGFDPNAEGQTVTVTDSSVTLTNLDGSTEYEVYVRYCNDAGCSDLSDPLSFTTEELVLGPECDSIAIDTNEVTDMAVTCRTENLLNSTNMTVCGTGTTSYLGGNEAVYTYTPTQSGVATVSYQGVSWSGIFIYQGCPTAGGECVISFANSATEKSVTFSAVENTTYYIIFDTFPSPDSPCPGTFSIVLEDGCEGTPDAGTISLDVTEGEPGTQGVITGEGYTEAPGIVYTYNFRVDEGDWEDLVTETPDSFAVTFGGEPGNEIEVRMAVTCELSMETSYSNSVFFSVIAPDDYCIPIYTSSFDYISSISTTGATQDISYSASSQPTGGYSDETASMLITETGSVFTLNTSYVGGGNGVKIWVDWNNDNYFGDSEVLAYQADGNADKTFTILIPEGIDVGIYRMRVRANYGSAADPDPCGSTSYGTAVDFSLQIGTLDACTGADAGTPAETELNICAGIGFSVSVNDPSEPADGLSRIWQSSPAGQDDWTDIALATGTTLNVSEGVTENTDYRYLVTCGDDSDASEVISIILNPANECYCIPDILYGCDDDELTNFSLTHDGGEVNYDDGCPGTDTYVDLTGTYLDMTPGFSYTGSANSVSSWTEAVSIWIDLNQDGLFSEDERLVTVPGIDNGPIDFTLTIPGSALTGQTRMRVGQNFSSAPTDPCGWSYGMAIDYSINMGEAIEMPCAEPEDIFIDDITSDSATVMWEPGDDPTGMQFEVIYGPAGFDVATEGESVTTEDPIVFLEGLDSDTEYDVYVRALCADGGESDWVGPESFTTEEVVVDECPAPTDLTVEANPEDTESSVIVTWIAGGVETMWVVIYGETGFTMDDDYNTEFVYDEPILVISGLETDVDYDVYVLAACDAASDNYSLPTGPFTFNILDLGITEVEFKDFVFYPNPVNNQLNLQANSPIENVEVYNLLGQLVSKTQPMSNEARLDVQSWQSGVYLMKITLNGVEKTFRVIRK